MSITPIPVGTAAPPAVPGEPSAAGGDGAFAALVASLLGQSAGGAAGSPVLGGAQAGEAVAGDVPGEPTDATDPADPAPAADATAAVAPVWTPLFDGLVPAPQPAAPGAGAVATAPVGVAGAGASPPAPPSYDGTRAADAATGAAGAPVDPSTDPATDPATVGTAAGSAASPDPGPAGPAATAPAAGPAAPVATPAPTATAPAAPAPAEGARPAPVVSQVVPEVTRLVARGDGVHRLTMRLQPEGLGDVRVTLTVRDGQVDVRLAAGDDARRALVEGAPELRRVLELTGATEARVLVRDLSGAAAPSGQQAWTTTGQQAGQQDPWTTGAHGGGGDASGRGEASGQGQHAGTRGGAAARDGHTDGATALRPDPAGRAPRGVDLTM